MVSLLGGLVLNSLRNRMCTSTAFSKGQLVLTKHHHIQMPGVYLIHDATILRKVCL